MEGLGRAIVGSLFVLLVVVTLMIFGFSLLTPLKRLSQPAGNTAPAPSPIQTGFWGSILNPPQDKPSEPSPSETQQPNQDKPSGTSVPSTPSISLTAIGTSPVVNGKVVTLSGEPVSNSVEPGSGSAPAVSRPISEEEYLKNFILITMETNGLNPNSFTVRSGQVVNLVTRSPEESAHVFKFRDKRLRGVALGIGPWEARAISFNAPEPGEYAFYCDIPGHRERETGSMIVN